MTSPKLSSISYSFQNIIQVIICVIILNVDKTQRFCYGSFISLLAYLDLNFCILSSISVFNSAHQPTPMRPMTSLPLAPSPHLPNGAASSPHLVRWRHRGNGRVNWLAILHEDGRGLIQNSYRYHPLVWGLCVRAAVGVGEATRGSRQPLETQSEEMPDRNHGDNHRREPSCRLLKRDPSSLQSSFKKKLKNVCVLMYVVYLHLCRKSVVKRCRCNIFA